MSLIVEAGFGGLTSNSYISLAGADEYHADLGNSLWVVTAEAENISARETALKKATVSIDATYAERWKGVRAKAEQSLAWPRIGAIDTDGYQLLLVPKNVQKATAELALRIFTGVDPLPDADNAKEVIQETIGPLSFTYSPSTSKTAMLPAFPIVEMLLSACVYSAGSVGSIKILRC